jgi:predicted RNA-binding protein associated with RNAse of E/G family
MYWYCDIVDYDFSDGGNVLTVTDLLADVLLYPDGRLKVVDLDELADANDRELITKEQLGRALRNLSRLLEIIYSRQFDSLTRPILEVMGDSAGVAGPNQ